MKSRGERGDLGHAELQLDWDAGNLVPHWPGGLDTSFVLLRTASAASDVTGEVESGRVLEIAAAEAIHACKLSLRGLRTFAIEPSPAMLERARQRIAEHGAGVTLVRGVAETLPFADRTFDRVLIDSAIDHLGNPQLSLREMTRVLKPDGRLIISFVNYGSLSVRLSRLWYAGARRAGLLSAHTHMPWDSPVPVEHTFECTYPLLSRLCEPHLELDRAVGISVGWMVPGWSGLLDRLPPTRALALVQRLDRLARRAPRFADFVVSVWRPRRAGAPPPPADPSVPADDVVYPGKVRAEARYWEAAAQPRPAALARLAGRQINAVYSGDPERTWLDDLIDRGPFARAALLGTGDGAAQRWLERGASAALDVYELSPTIIRAQRAALGAGPWRRHGATRLRFVRADLNFARLPGQRYDVVWSDDGLHHVVNLEQLFTAIARALRPGGLFAFREYVGERRMQYSARRLERINALLAAVPARWRRADLVAAPPLHTLSPHCAIRSDEIVELSRRRFDVVALRPAGALAPLQQAVDTVGLAAEAPELAARLDAAEQDALRDPQLGPLETYAVLRVR